MEGKVVEEDEKEGEKINEVKREKKIVKVEEMKVMKVEEKV